MFHVNDIQELIVVFSLVFIAQALLYFAQRWMDKG